MILDALKGIKNLTLDEPNFIKIYTLDGIELLEVKGSLLFNYKGENFEVNSFAKVSKEDMDLSTETVGENITEMRLMIAVLDIIIDKFLHLGEEMEDLVNLRRHIKTELFDYIILKDEFFKKVRKKRTDPDYNKIRHISVDDKGVPKEIGQ